MAQPMIGCRVPQEWQTQINDLAVVTGRTPSEVVREAVASYLGKVDPTAIKSVLAEHHERLTKLEGKLARLGS